MQMKQLRFFFLDKPVCLLGLRLGLCAVITQSMIHDQGWVIKYSE